MPELYPPLPLVGGPQNRFAIRMMEDMKLQDSKKQEALDEELAALCRMLATIFHTERPT